jgi:hypothetical protein
MRSRLTRAGLVALCTLVLAPLVAAQGYDQLLPDSTIVYVSVENIARTKERFQETALHGLWNDPAMKAFMEKPLHSWSEAMRKQKEETGFNMAEILDLVSGQAMLAVPGVDDKGDPRMVALVDIGKNADKVREVIAKAEETLLADGKIRRDEEEFAGVTIVRYSNEDEEAPARDGPDCWFVSDGLFGAADDTEDLKRLLVRRGEEAAGSLAAREVYVATRRRFGARADLFAYFDLKNLLGAMAEGGELNEDNQRILGALGILNVDAVALQLAIEPHAVDMQISVPLNGPKKGLLKLFDGTPSNLVPPRFIPSDAVNAGVVMFDLNALWAEAVKVVNEIEPGRGMMMDAGIQMLQGQIGMDVKAVLAALGDEVAYFFRIPDPDQPGASIPAPGMGMLSVPRFAAAFSVRDKDTLDREMNNMVAAVGEGVSELEYLGVKIRYFDTGMGMIPSLAVLPDRFVFALHLDDVKAILNRYGKDVKGIADRPEFARATEGLPAQRTMIDYADQARAIHQSLSGMADLLGGILGGGPAMLDKSLVPGVEVFQKYLDASASAMASEERAIYYRARIGLKDVEEAEKTDEPAKPGESTEPETPDEPDDGSDDGG